MSTAIEWTNETWNPLRARTATRTGWHCEKVSPGCVVCYAERLNEKRFGTGLPYNRKSRDQVEVFVDLATLVKPLHWRRPRKIFVCSMTDLFGEWVTDEVLDRIFAVMALSPQHTFQVLTKRPERMRAYMLGWWKSAPDFQEAAHRIGRAMISVIVEQSRAKMTAAVKGAMSRFAWPLKNVWLGVSVEDKQRADERIPELLATPAAVRFISAEPLLGAVDLHEYVWKHHEVAMAGRPGAWAEKRDIDLVIVGGESGPGARPMDLAWARSLRDQCQAAGVAFFMKQDSGPRPGQQGRIPDDLWIKEFPNAV